MFSKCLLLFLFLLLTPFSSSFSTTTITIENNVIMKIQLDNICVGRPLPSTVRDTDKQSANVSFLSQGPLKSILNLSGVFSSFSPNLTQNVHISGAKKNLNSTE